MGCFEMNFDFRIKDIKLLCKAFAILALAKFISSPHYLYLLKEIPAHLQKTETRYNFLKFSKGKRVSEI